MTQQDILNLLNSKPNTWFKTQDIKAAGVQVSSGSICKQLRTLTRFKWIEKKSFKVEFKDGGKKELSHYRINKAVYK